MEEYFLHVDVIVPKERVDEFEGNMVQFLARGAFQHFEPDFDNELVLALKTPEPFEYTGYRRFQSARLNRDADRDHRVSPGQKVFRYVHLWRMPDLEDLNLARVMKRSADDKLYMAINASVARELQNFVLRVRWLGKVRPPNTPGHFVRVIRQFRSQDLGTYLFTVGTLFPILAENHWTTLGHYQSITGPLNTVTEFWHTTDGGGEAESMDEALTSLGPAMQKRIVEPLRTLPVADVRETLVRASYQPQGVA